MIDVSKHWNQTVMMADRRYLFRDPISGKVKEMGPLQAPNYTLVTRDYTITDVTITSIGPVALRYRWWVLRAKVWVWLRNIFYPWDKSYG